MLPPSIVGKGLGIGCYCVEIDLESGKAKSTPTLIRHSKHGQKIAEGPHIYKKEGTYYLTTAEGGTEKDHQQWIFKSSVGPLGPWEEPPSGVNPILYNGDSREIQQTGHMDLVQGDDGWWAVFLGTRGSRYEEGGWSQLGRESFLAPVEWSGEWPVVNDKGRIYVYGEQNASMKGKTICHDVGFKPSEGEPLLSTILTIDLPLGWYHLRTPMTKEWFLTERPGWLTLYGSPYTLRVDESPVALFRKQTAFKETVCMELDFNPLEGEEAGVTIWWSRSAYASLSIIGSTKGRALQMTWCEPDSDEFTVRFDRHRR